MQDRLRPACDVDAIIAEEGATVTCFTAHVVADELSTDCLRRHDRYLQVRDRTLAHVLNDDCAWEPKM